MSPFIRPSDIIWLAIFSAFAADISSKDPNSSKVILLYNLLAESKLCSNTARSRIDEPSRVDA